MPYYGNQDFTKLATGVYFIVIIINPIIEMGVALAFLQYCSEYILIQKSHQHSFSIKSSPNSDFHSKNNEQCTLAKAELLYLKNAGA